MYMGLLVLELLHGSVASFMCVVDVLLSPARKALVWRIVQLNKE